MKMPISELFDRLCIVNLKIWTIIDRQNGDVSDEQKGKLAVELIRQNAYRSKLKQAVEEYFGQDSPGSEKFHG